MKFGYIKSINFMKISVITAVLNRKNTIGHCINSVQSQDYCNVEHIIQDGCSTDGSLDVIAKFANGSTCIVSEPDDGIYDAINRGIMRSTGDVIGLMHSDDFFPHERVLSLVAAALSDPRVDGVYGDVLHVASDNVNRIIRYWRSGEYTHSKLRFGWMPPHPTVYLRREVFDKWGLYDAKFRVAGDYDALLRFLSRGGIKLAYIPEIMVKMRVGGESNGSIINIWKKSSEDLIALRSNKVGGVPTLIFKNLRKIIQFFSK